MEACFGRACVGIGVGRANFKIGVGFGSPIEGAGGANFEIGTPPPFAVRLVGQRVPLGRPGQPIEMPEK